MRHTSCAGSVRSPDPGKLCTDESSRRSSTPSEIRWKSSTPPHRTRGSKYVPSWAPCGSRRRGRPHRIARPNVDRAQPRMPPERHEWRERQDVEWATGAVAPFSAMAASSPGCIDPPRRLGFDLWTAQRFRARSPTRGSSWDRASPEWSTATMPRDASSIAAQSRDGRRSSNGRALSRERRGSSSRGQSRASHRSIRAERSLLRQTRRGRRPTLRRLLSPLTAFRCPVRRSRRRPIQCTEPTGSCPKPCWRADASGYDVSARDRERVTSGLSAYLEDAPETLEPDVIGGGYRTALPRTLPEMLGWVHLDPLIVGRCAAASTPGSLTALGALVRRHHADHTTDRSIRTMRA
jgi:hypothetical protein